VKLPVVSARECITVLQKAGFVFDRQNGSHATYIRTKPYARVTIPKHGTLAPGTLRSILRSAGLTIEEFVNLL
jgi:predicted RNA binding protein YcfA (HicA-like mRNA interferase family)